MNRMLKVIIGAVLTVIGFVLFFLHFVPEGNELRQAYGIPDYVHWLAASLTFFIGLAVLIAGLRSGRRHSADS